MRILLIEDEDELREQIAEALRERDEVVEVAASGEEGFYLGSEYPFDVAVVDLGLPDLEGQEVIRRWREQGRDFPILILTARARWQDKVAGLEAGADDYLVKPFHMEELHARLRALVRRAAGWSQPVWRFGPLVMDTAAQTVHVDGRPVELTAFEYKLLHHLARNAGQVVSKLELTEHLYAQDYDRDSNVIEVLIGRLRRKLDPEGNLKPIETLRGRGYRFALPRDEG